MTHFKQLFSNYDEVAEKVSKIDFFGAISEEKEDML